MNTEIKKTSYKSGNRPIEVIDYIQTIGNRISGLKFDLIKETTQLFPEDIKMLTEPSEGELLKMLVQLTNSKKGIEIGVFTGYSSICMAEALPEDGKLLCLDISEKFTNVAKKYWELANLSKKIDLILAPGLEILDKLLKDENNLKSFDFAYIDADKTNYSCYFEKLVPLMKTGGWLAFDNTLWKGKVAYENCTDPKTLALRTLNQTLRNDSRVDINMVPISDGLTLVRIK